jgi:hypothetical protein
MPISTYSEKKNLGPYLVAFSSVAEPEPHHLVGAGAVTRCGSGSNNGAKHGYQLKNDTKCTGNSLKHIQILFSAI